MAGNVPPSPDQIVELNVGGVFFTTTVKTLTNDSDSLIAKFFSSKQIDNVQSKTSPIIKRLPGSENRFFIDRNGELFKFILDYLRNDKKLLLPEKFNECKRLKAEAKFYKMDDLLAKLGKLTPQSQFSLPSLDLKLEDQSAATSSENGLTSKASRVSLSQLFINSGHIVVGYRGTFAFGRDGKADVKFRKLNRILISGKANLCKQVFNDTLNETRDPDRGGENRYTSRLYLKHCNLECAFDMLADRGFRLVGSCASGTCFAGGNDAGRSGVDGEEQRWNHYNEFVFYKPPD